jgi:hypothetical protein
VRARSALDEARLLVGEGLEPRVLEPSPPAVVDGVWFADDPTAGADVDWKQWVVLHPEHQAWARERWLAAYGRVGQVPDAYNDSRRTFHRLAAYVISPARQRANGKMALRWTLGGIGTPFFGADEQVRMVGTDLVLQRGEQAWVEPITTLDEAAAFVLDSPPDDSWAKGFDVPPIGPTGEKLAVSVDGARFFADWYGFAWSVLEELRADAECDEPNRVQLWPEHLDAAFDCGLADRRATFGASPGDTSSNGPYLYVLSPGASELSDELWNSSSFEGAVLPFSDLVNALDQRAKALQFFRVRRTALARS